jgi:hypothetical protein
VRVFNIDQRCRPCNRAPIFRFRRDLNHGQYVPEVHAQSDRTGSDLCSGSQHDRTVGSRPVDDATGLACFLALGAAPGEPLHRTRRRQG